MSVQLIPYITVKNAAEAHEFYKKAFGAEVVSSTTMPLDGKVLHSEITIDGASVYVMDEFPHMGALDPNGYGGSAVSLLFRVENADEWYNRAVEAGCTVSMPLEDQFWGDRFGSVKDPYGHLWCFNQKIREVSQEEINEILTNMPGMG